MRASPTSTALWADLLHRSTRRPAFRLVREGATTAPASVTRPARIGDRDLDDLAAPNRVIDGYRDGCTVVLQGLHLTDPALARFANNLALELDQPVQLNAYLSPSSARGLDVHFDYHDVFVVQLDGTKRWRVWEPIERSRDPIGGKHVVAAPDVRRAGRAAARPRRSARRRALPAARPPARRRDHRPGVGAPDRRAAGDHLAPRRAARRSTTRSRPVGCGRRSRSRRSTTRSPSATTIDRRVVDHAGPRRLQLDLRSIELRRWVADEIWSRQAATRLRPLEPADPAAADRPLAFAPGPLITLSRSGSRSLLFVGDRTISHARRGPPVPRRAAPAGRADLPAPTCPVSTTTRRESSSPPARRGRAGRASDRRRLMAGRPTTSCAPTRPSGGARWWSRRRRRCAAGC